MNKQNKISLILGVLVLTVLIVTSSFAFFQITNTDSSTSSTFTGETENIEDYGKSVLSGGIEGYHINILASDMAPSKIGTHYYGTIDQDSNYSLERKNYEISNVSIVEGKNNENVEYTCTSELTITLEGTLTGTKEDGSYYIQKGDGTLYLSGSNLNIDKRQIDLKEIIENATINEEGIKEFKKTLTYIISKGNNGTLNVDFDIINRDVVQNDIAGKNIEITLRNSNLQCEVSGRKVYASLDTANSTSNATKYRSSAYKDKIVSASFVDYVPSEEELESLTHWDLTNVNQSSTNPNTSPANSVIGWLETTKENPEQYDLYIGSKDTIYTTDLSSSFRQMTNLQEINFDNLNTSEITNMSYMFQDCSNLTTIDLSNFDTSKVTKMNSMFYNCTNLKELPFEDWQNFVTCNVENMSSMFKGCNKLTTLDLSTFDTSKVTNMSWMFNGVTVDLPFKDWSNFVTTNVENMNYMFMSYKGTSLDLSTFDTSKVTDMNSMFYGYKGTALDLSTFDTSQVIDMSYMFYGVTVDLPFKDWPNFVTTNVEKMNSMFDGYKGTILDLSTFDTSQVIDMSYMFSSTSVDLPFKDWPNFVTTNVENMGSMFSSYKGKTLDLSTFDTSKVIDMNSMFAYTSLELPFKDWPNFVTTNVENMNMMFYNYNGSTLDLSTFDTSKVTKMNSMFYNCNKLTTLDLSNFTFDNVTKGTSSSFGNYRTFYNVPSNCQVKINPSQLETFKDKFPLGTGTYDRKFRVPGEE